MRYFPRLVLLLILGFSFSANAAKGDIRIEIDETDKITGLSSYAFVDETDPENLPSAPRRREYFRAARVAIMDEMKRKGYTKVVKENAELLVDFTGMGVVVPRSSTIYVDRNFGMPVLGTATMSKNVDGNQGMIRILVSLPGEENNLWSATGVLDAGTGPKQNMRRINKLIKQIFKEFPDSAVK